MTPSPRSPREDSGTTIALIQQDIAYMKAGQARIEEELRDLKAYYVTKDQMLAALQTRDDVDKALLERIKNVEGGQQSDRERNQFYLRSIITSLVTAVIGLGVTIYLAHIGGK